MQYILMTHIDPEGWTWLTPSERDQGLAAYAAYVASLTKAGALKSANRLQPASMATTVRTTNGKSQVVDGPFTDTKEQLGGYFVIDVPDLDAAIAWAARCPAASHGVVEVRPLWVM